MSNDRLAVLPQYLLPKGALTRFAGRVASVHVQEGALVEAGRLLVVIE